MFISGGVNLSAGILSVETIEAVKL